MGGVLLHRRSRSSRPSGLDRGDHPAMIATTGPFGEVLIGRNSAVRRRRVARSLKSRKYYFAGPRSVNWGHFCAFLTSIRACVFDEARNLCFASNNLWRIYHQAMVPVVSADNAQPGLRQRYALDFEQLINRLCAVADLSHHGGTLTAWA